MITLDGFQLNCAAYSTKEFVQDVSEHKINGSSAKNNNSRCSFSNSHGHVRCFTNRQLTLAEENRTRLAVSIGWQRSMPIAHHNGDITLNVICSNAQY